MPTHQISTAVLLSGGLDSAVLLAEEARRATVQPIYVSAGLAWESAERDMIARLLAREPLYASVLPLVSLSVEMRDVYAATHWAVKGTPPAYHTPDEEVYLPGRNLILFGKAGVFCAGANIRRIVVGTLGHNPFPDATPEFRASMARTLSLGLGHTIEIDAPYAEISKGEVVRRGLALGVPFELTLSCMNPVTEKGTGVFSAAEKRTGVFSSRGSEHAVASQEKANKESRPLFHCGLCSKCRERHDAFLEAGVNDPTDYADRTHISASR